MLLTDRASWQSFASYPLGGWRGDVLDPSSPPSSLLHFELSIPSDTITGRNSQGGESEAVWIGPSGWEQQ